MKTINFLGRDWQCPDWATFITQNDDNGAICVWENMPRKVGTSWYAVNWTDPGESRCVGHVEVKPNIMRV